MGEDRFLFTNDGIEHGLRDDDLLIGIRVFAGAHRNGLEMALVVVEEHDAAIRGNEAKRHLEDLAA